MTTNQIGELVLANRILYRQGTVDAFGHVSVRCEHDSDHFYMTRAVAPALAKASDVLLYALDGEARNADGADLYSERFIHAAIYASRPDVHGVVHSHSPSVIPFTISQVELQPVCTTTAFIGDGVGLFDSQDIAGDSDMLIRTLELGRALAVELKQHSVVLLRGHGSVVVGRSLREAVSRAIYTEVNAKLQAEALRLGTPVTYLTRGEAARMTALSKPDVRRPWELWVHELGPARDSP